MPERDYVWLPREDILQFEEIDRLVDVFLDLGVRKVRLTGGEPLLRKTCRYWSNDSARKARLEDLAMTTNGVLLAPMARRAERRRAASADDQPRHAAAGSFRPPGPLRRARSGRRGHRRAPRGCLPGFKIDTVVIRGVNDDELIAIWWSSRKRAARKCASSNTWTSAAPPAGAGIRW